MTFLCLETPAVISIIAVVLVQYALATFCLLKLAFLDVSKKEYVLWNLFILLVFFIGDIAFLIYWSKVKDKKRIPPLPPAAEQPQAQDNDGPSEQTEQTEQGEQAEQAEISEPEQEEIEPEQTVGDPSADEQKNENE